MKRILVIMLTILFAFTAAYAEEAAADPETLFIDILAVMLNENEMADISGGDVEVMVVLGEDHSGTATITITPRYTNGKRAMVDQSIFTVAVHNRVTGTVVEDKRRNDFYITDQFPAGTYTITGVSKATAGYGNSAGEWVTTDATRIVQASKTSENNQLTGPVYLRQDGGYFWHNNLASSFESSKSYGCIVSTKEDMDRVATTIKSDTNPKSVKTITVVQPKKLPSFEKDESRSKSVQPTTAAKPTTVAKPAAVAQPVAVARPAAVAQPTVVAKPAAVAQPVAVARPAAVAQPTTVAKSAPVVKPKEPASYTANIKRQDKATPDPVRSAPVKSEPVQSTPRVQKPLMR